MKEKKKLIELIIGILDKTDYSCEICNKMGYKCPLEIPEDADSGFQPDFSKCAFKASIYKTLTIDS